MFSCSFLFMYVMHPFYLSIELKKKYVYIYFSTKYNDTLEWGTSWSIMEEQSTRNGAARNYVYEQFKKKENELNYNWKTIAAVAARKCLYMELLK